MKTVLARAFAVGMIAEQAWTTEESMQRSSSRRGTPLLASAPPSLNGGAS